MSKLSIEYKTPIIIAKQFVKKLCAQYSCLVVKLKNYYNLLFTLNFFTLSFKQDKRFSLFSLIFIERYILFTF